MMGTGLGEILSGECPQIDSERLVVMLRELLAGADANGGKMALGDFCRFSAAVTQGREITEALHDVGTEAANAVAKEHPSPASTLADRQRRAYHIALLRQFLMEVGGLPGEASVLPGNFKHGVIVSDLSAMLGGHTGEGQGSTPQILSSNGEGATALRHHAQWEIVCGVYWRAGRDGGTLSSVYEGLGLDKELWDPWLRRLRRDHPDFPDLAREAGAHGSTAYGRFWSRSDAERAKVLELARKAPGRGPKRKKVIR